MTAPTESTIQPTSDPANLADRLRQVYRLDIFCVIWFAYLLLVGRFWFVTDDAFISFRYSRNLAMGLGLRYNVGENPPVEGYSNFLWVLVGAVFEYLHMDVTFWVPLLSTLCGSILLLLIFDLLHRRMGVQILVAAIATLSLGLYPPFALWSSSGLETVPFALFTYLTFERLILRKDNMDPFGAALFAMLTVLVRAEGFAWVGVITLMAVGSRWMAGQLRSKPFILYTILVAAGMLLYFGWRYSYYHSLLPNTAHAKTGLTADYYKRGLNYVAVQFLTFLTPFLLLITSWFALCRKRHAIGLAVIAMAWAYPAYSIATTGDFMTMGRFLIPGLAFNTILLAWMLNDLAGGHVLRQGIAVTLGLAVVAIGMLPGWNIHIVPEQIRKQFHFRFNMNKYFSEYDQWQLQKSNAVSWADAGRALKIYATKKLTPNASLVIGAIGAKSYYSELIVYDINGLVTAEVARRPFEPGAKLKSPGHDKTVDPAFFLPRNPTILQSNVIPAGTPSEAMMRLGGFAAAMRNQWKNIELEKQYAPDFARLDVKDTDGNMQYLAVYRRLDAGLDAQAEWKKFQAQLRRLGTDGSAPLLSLRDNSLTEESASVAPTGTRPAGK